MQKGKLSFSEQASSQERHAPPLNAESDTFACRGRRPRRPVPRRETGDSALDVPSPRGENRCSDCRTCENILLWRVSLESAQRRGGSKEGRSPLLCRFKDGVQGKGEKSPPLSFQGWGPGEGKSKSLPLACFLFLSTFSWARGHERLPPVSAPFRGFLSRLACWASAQRRSLGATIPRKKSAHRCCTVFTEQICDESRRRPRIILSYSQGLQRRVGANLPAKTDRGSSPLAPARAKRKWTRKQAAERRRGIAFSPLPITRAGDIITCLTLL